MKKFFQRLFSRFSKQQRSPSIPAAIPRRSSLIAPDWLPQHQAALKHFLGTEAGVTLMARFAAVEAQCAVNACRDTFHSAHSAGRANGWGECRAWLESLSRSSRVTDESPELDGREASGSTHHKRGLIQSEAELLELLSP